MGMLSGWGDDPAVAQTLEEASDALGEDLSRLISEGPADLLALTTNTQPVMLVAGVAAYRAWLARTGAPPHLVAGHSLGEYAALVASGVLTLAQAVPLVRLRAQAMQEAVPLGRGAMAAILGLPASDVVAACAQAQANFGAGSAEVVEAANFNDPGQTVISGTQAAVNKACELLKAAGAKRALPLAVSAPFHCSLMKPAADRLRQHFANVSWAAPKIPLVNNIDVAISSDPSYIRDALYRQVFGPVRWVEDVLALKAQGVTHVIECGPGKVLTGLVKRIAADLVGAPLYDQATCIQVQELLV